MPVPLRRFYGNLLIGAKEEKEKKAIEDSKQSNRPNVKKS